MLQKGEGESYRKEKGTNCLAAWFKKIRRTGKRQRRYRWGLLANEEKIEREREGKGREEGEGDGERERRRRRRRRDRWFDLRRVEAVDKEMMTGRSYEAESRGAAARDSLRFRFSLPLRLTSASLPLRYSRNQEERASLLQFQFLFTGTARLRLESHICKALRVHLSLLELDLDSTESAQHPDRRVTSSCEGVVELSIFLLASREQLKRSC